MSVGAWMVLMAVAAPSPQDLLPCAPGRSVTYRLERDGEDTGVRITETVRGMKKRLCIIDRVTRRPDGSKDTDALALEVLDDRVSNAGWADTPRVMRPPLVKAPVKAGQSWTFNRVAYRIDEVGSSVEVPAGSFSGCVRVSERAIDGAKHAAYSIYAPHVGLIVRVTDDTRLVATSVERGEGTKGTTQRKSHRTSKP